MLGTQIVEVTSIETYKSKISFLPYQDLIAIEHFSKTGQLLSKTHMDLDEALEYTRLINEVVDEALELD